MIVILLDDKFKSDFVSSTRRMSLFNITLFVQISQSFKLRISQKLFIPTLSDITCTTTRTSVIIMLLIETSSHHLWHSLQTFQKMKTQRSFGSIGPVVLLLLTLVGVMMMMVNAQSSAPKYQLNNLVRTSNGYSGYLHLVQG